MDVAAYNAYASGEAYASRSRSLDVDGIAWNEIPRHRLSDDVLRVLRYMQNIETYTTVYARSLLSTRAIDDPEIATFLACWLYEETCHGLALSRFLAAYGDPVEAPKRSRMPISEWMDAIASRVLSLAWPDFVALHMTWGAINELTTLTGYERLRAVAEHPILAELLARIMRDEARHFSFYYRQAEQRLARPRAASITRLIIEHYWAPVGRGVAGAEETRALARCLLTGPDGQNAARKIDTTIRKLPGLSGIRLVQSWLARELPATH